MSKKYTVLHQDDAHFLMQHPDGSHFKVAKHAIDPVTRHEIQKLADGGDVMPADADAASAVAQFPAAPDVVLEGGVPDQQRGMASMPVTDERPLDSGLGAPTPTPPTRFGLPVAPPVPVGEGALKGAMLGDAMTAAQQKAASTDGTSAAPKPNVNAVPGYQAQQLRGIQEEAAAKADLGAKQAQVYDDLATRLTEADKTFQETHAKYTARTEQLMNDIASSKIDPNHYWADKGAASKVTAAIAMVISGWGAGLSHTNNLAMETINRAIDRDIDAQKADLSNKHTLLSQNLAMTHDLESATSLTKSNMLSIATAQAGKIAGQNAGPMAKANLDMLQGQLKGQFTRDNFELAKRQALSQFMTGGAGGAAGNPNFAALFAGDVKPEQFVTLPNGQMRLASSSEDAKELKKGQTSIASINSILQRMKAFRKDHGATVPGSAADDLGHQMREQLVLEMGKFADLARFTPEEAKRYEQLVSHPGRVRGDKFENSIQNLEDSLRDKMDTLYSNHLMGYKPVKAQR